MLLSRLQNSQVESQITQILMGFKQISRILKVIQRCLDVSALIYEDKILWEGILISMNRIYPTKKLLIAAVQSLLHEKTSEKVSIENSFERSRISRESVYYQLEDFDENFNLSK